MYQQYHRPTLGQQFTHTIVGRLIIANVAVYLLQVLFPGFTLAFALRPRLVIEQFQVWQLVTYMFLHGSFFSHLFFNMLVLWFLGPPLEAAWGPRNFLRYYLVCGLGGGLLSMVFHYNGLVLGASGAIFGIYLAFALMYPDTYLLIWFVLPVKAKYLVAGLALMQLFLVGGGTHIAWGAHIGGLLTGLIFFKSELLRRLRFNVGPKRRFRSYMKDRHKSEAPPDTDNIDSILDKISAKGYDNLSTTEKRILENYSRKRREEGE
jgi:membrane associated rhomboid family serine protease